MGLIGDLFTFTVGQIMNQVTQDKQFANEQYMMDKQAEHNKELAKYSSELQKQMWDYTNYENQKKHMEAAGLNPALMYGMSGGGGSTTGSASAGSVSNPGTQAVGMGLQAAMIASQIRLNESEASKNDAEADKTRGVDTEFTKAQTKLTEYNAALSEKKGKLTDEEIETQKQITSKYTQEVRLLMTQADIAEETKENEIQKSAQELDNMIWDGCLKTVQYQLTESQTKYIDELRETVWYNAISYRRTADAAKEQSYTAAKRLIAEIKKWNKELDQEDERILQTYLFQSIDAILELGDIVTEFFPTKKAGQIIDTILTEDSKGNWKTTRRTRSERGTTKKGK